MESSIVASSSSLPPSTPPNRRLNVPKRDQHTLTISSTILFLAIFSSAIATVPRLRLTESKVCRFYHLLQSTGGNSSSVISATQFANGGEVPELYCKTSPVQTELSTLLGWNSFLGTIPSLLLATFYSLLIETISRRTLLLINVVSSIIGMTCHLLIVHISTSPSSLRWIWIVNLFDSVGGGSLVFNTMVQVMIAKSVPGAGLSKLLFNLTAILTASRMLGVMIGSYLMGTTPWLPLIIASMLSILRIPPILLLDDLPAAISTIDLSHQRHQRARAGRYVYHVLRDTELHPNSQADADISSRYDSNEGNTDLNPALSCLQHRTNDTYPNMANFVTNISIRTILSSLPTLYLATLYDLYRVTRTNLLVLIIFFIHELAMGVRNIAEQWMSTRYSIPFSQVSYILSMETLVSAGVLALIPVAVRFISSRPPLPPMCDQSHHVNSATALKLQSTTTTAAGAHIYGARRAMTTHAIGARLKTDASIARISLVFASLGGLAIGLSPSLGVLVPALLVFAMGVGFHDALKAYATNIIIYRYSQGLEEGECAGDEERLADMPFGTSSHGDAGSNMEMEMVRKEEEGEKTQAAGQERNPGQRDEQEEDDNANEEYELEVSRFYMCLSVLEIIANMFSGPAWPIIYAAAVGTKESSMAYLVGFPFWVSAVAFWTALMILGFLLRGK